MKSTENFSEVFAIADSFPLSPYPTLVLQEVTTRYIHNHESTSSLLFCHLLFYSYWWIFTYISRKMNSEITYRNWKRDKDFLQKSLTKIQNNLIFPNDKLQVPQEAWESTEKERTRNEAKSSAVHFDKMAGLQITLTFQPWTIIIAIDTTMFVFVLRITNSFLQNVNRFCLQSQTLFILFSQKISNTFGHDLVWLDWYKKNYLQWTLLYFQIFKYLFIFPPLKTWFDRYSTNYLVWKHKNHQYYFQIIFPKQKLENENIYQSLTKHSCISRHFFC